MRQNVAAPVGGRLFNRSKQTGDDFQLILTRYGCERFLYRLGASSVRDRFILKGATLLALWMDEPYRATRDVDMLAFGRNDEAAIRKAMETICKVPCPEDGLTFDVSTLNIPMIAAQVYSGQRASLVAYLENARIQVKVDFGFGDVITAPGYEEVNLPTLIDGLPAPRLHTYRRVTTVAEKVESMVQLGRRNSRMKDFYDLWALSERFDFDGPALHRAIAGCFKRRGTSLIADTPDVLRKAFYEEYELPRSRWKSYLGSTELLEPPPQHFEDIGARIRTFIGPVRKSILAGVVFDMYWPAGGPWKPNTSLD